MVRLHSYHSVFISEFCIYKFNLYREGAMLYNMATFVLYVISNLWIYNMVIEYPLMAPTKD